MRRVLLFTVVLAFAGCGGGGGGAKTHAPTDADLNKLAVTSDIATQCLSPTGMDEAKLQEDVDVLIEEYRKLGPDQQFKLVPTGPKVTMRKLMLNARGSLQACAQAGLGGTAAQPLVDRINRELDRAE